LNGAAYNFSAPVTSDLTLVAVYRAVTSATYTVTFNSNGGNMYDLPSRIKVNDGSLVTKPSTNPFKFHNNFVEWQLNGVTYDFSMPVTSNLTLVAVYEPIHTVTFNTTKDGTVVPPKKVNNGSLVTKPDDPIKINSNFVEWQLNGVTYDFSTPVTSNLTLVAVYEPIHKVTFNTNGGIGYAPPKKVNNGSLVEKPSDPFNFNGAFVEWQLNGVAYNFSTPVTSNITLVAVYK
jgi:Listeria-Bacteroides repeat domain (List_Bact_rpt).